MRILPTILLISIALTAGGQSFAIQVGAGPTQKATPPVLAVMQSNGVSLSEAVEQVRRQYKGKILKAETQVSGNRETHVIRVLMPDGKVRTVRVPGRRLS